MLKITLESDKVVVIREMNIADQRSAARNTGKTVNDAEMQVAMQYELLKLILVSIDEKVLKGQEKENLKEHLDWKEYNEIMLVIQDMLGNAKMPKVEVMTE